jgi:raffinose/stachyose/melibiose transport system permease protein
MEEAACIDGASILVSFLGYTAAFHTGAFYKGMFVFVGNWNELLVAKIFTTSPTVATLPVTLTNFVSPYQVNYGPMLAAIVLALYTSVMCIRCSATK